MFLKFSRHSDNVPEYQYWFLLRDVVKCYSISSTLFKLNPEILTLQFNNILVLGLGTNFFFSATREIGGQMMYISHTNKKFWKKSRLMPVTGVFSKWRLFRIENRYFRHKLRTIDNRIVIFGPIPPFSTPLSSIMAVLDT